MWPLIPIGLGLAALLGGGRRNQTTTPPPVWEPLSFDVPEWNQDRAPSEQEMESVQSQIEQLQGDLGAMPDYGTMEQYVGVQQNIDDLEALLGQMETAAVPVTTAPPTAEVMFGDDPDLLNLYNTQGTVEAPFSATGRITLDPEKFQQDVASLRLTWQPSRTIDPNTGAEMLDFDNQVLVYDNPATAEEEAWNLAHYSPEYQRAAEEAAYAPEILGEQEAGGGATDIQNRYMDMLENLMTMIAQPQAQAQQPSFISRSEAAGEEEPLEAEAGFQQQSGLGAEDLLSMLLNFGQGM